MVYQYVNVVLALFLANFAAIVKITVVALHKRVLVQITFLVHLCRCNLKNFAVHNLEI